jgi:hypothetical protein
MYSKYELIVIDDIFYPAGKKTLYKRKKHQPDFADFKDRFPSCFVYFCNELETVENVSESLKMV